MFKCPREVLSPIEGLCRLTCDDFKSIILQNLKCGQPKSSNNGDGNKIKTLNKRKSEAKDTRNFFKKCWEIWEVWVFCCGNFAQGDWKLGVTTGGNGNRVEPGTRAYISTCNTIYNMQDTSRYWQ